MVLNILRSRKVARKVLIALSILIIPAFVLWGVNSATNKTKVVGKIFGKPVKLEEFLSSVTGIKAELILAYSNNYKMINQFWKNQSFVKSKAWERLILLSAAKKQRIKVSDKEVMDFIMKHPLFQRNGQFDIKTYEFIIQNNFSFSPHKFEELIRDNLIAENLRNKILSEINVSDEDTYDYYRLLNDKYVFSYILFSPDLYKGQVSIPEDAVEKFYSATKDNYFDPQKIEIEYLEIPFTSESDRSSAETTAKELKEKLQDSNGSLADSADSENIKYKHPDPFSKNDPIPGISFSSDLQNLLFSLNDGEISKPVVPYKETGSVYLIRKIKTVPKKMKGFSEVKTAITDVLAEKQRFSLAEKNAGTLYADIKNGLTMEDAASSVNLELNKTQPITINDYIEKIGPAKEIITLAQDTPVNNVLSPITTKKGILLIRIDEKIPADEKGYEDQKQNLKKFLSFQQGRQVMTDWLNKNVTDTELMVSFE